MTAAIGHNSRDVTVTAEVRLFNAIARFANGQGTHRRIVLPAGTTVGELAGRLGIPRGDIFLALVNGRDVTPGLVGAAINGHHVVEEGDVVALSGAVPYSYGYGAPVV